MKFTRIARYVQQTPWAVTEDKFADLMDVLVMRMSGERFSDEDIRLRVGAAMGGNAARIDAAAETTRQSGGAVAVVPLLGTIFHRAAESMEESSGGTSTTAFLSAFRSAAANPEVGTILIDTDSPGGTVAGVAEVADEVFAARDSKRIVALSDDLMASAAYHIASQAHEIVSIPSGTVGSIGVFAAHEDLSKRAELLGVKVTLISAGKYKTDGNPFEPLSDDARAQFQARVDDAYARFVKAVARGRGVTPDEVRNGYGQGRVLGAKDALKAGLIDKIATRDETIGRLIGKRGGSRAQTMPAMVAVDADLRRRLERF
jgi:signal peptide peptidase SppA